MIQKFALLTTALLFGGMTLYSFGFAAFLFKALPPDLAGSLLRRAFPHFYAFVIVCAFVGSVLAVSFDVASAIILVLIAFTAVLARQVLMPAINAASDTEDRSRFKVIHTGSVLVTLAHIAGSAAAIFRLS